MWTELKRSSCWPYFLINCAVMDCCCYIKNNQNLVVFVDKSDFVPQNLFYSFLETHFIYKKKPQQSLRTREKRSKVPTIQNPIVLFDMSDFVPQKCFVIIVIKNVFNNSIYCIHSGLKMIEGTKCRIDRQHVPQKITLL